MICSSVHTKLATPNPRAASATIGYSTSCPGPWYVAHPPRSDATHAMPRAASSASDTRSSLRVARLPSVIVGGCSTAMQVSCPPAHRARQHASWTANADS